MGNIQVPIRMEARHIPLQSPKFEGNPAVLFQDPWLSGSASRRMWRNCRFRAASPESLSEVFLDFRRLFRTAQDAVIRQPPRLETQRYWLRESVAKRKPADINLSSFPELLI